MAERRVGPGRHSGVTGTLIVLGVLLLGVNALEEVKRKVGDDVTLEPRYGDPSEIKWKINGNKLVDMKWKPKVDIHFYRLQDRVNINPIDGRLTIRNLDIGDSGLYRAEAVVNNTDQKTEFKLTVLRCPDKPTLINESTEDRIIVRCVPSTPDVTYKWLKSGKSVGTNQSYNESRPKEDVRLTCVVDNGLCSNNSSITIPYIPEPSPIHKGIVALIVILVLVPILVVGIALLHRFRKKCCLKTIYNVLTCNKTSCMVKAFEMVYIALTCCKGKHSIANDLKKKNGTKNPENNGQKAEDEPLILEESDSCGCIAFNLPCEETMQLLKFRKDRGPSIEVEVNEVNGQPERIVSLSVTIDGVKPADYRDYAAEAVMYNGKKRLFPIKADEFNVEEENAAAAVDEKVADEFNVEEENAAAAVDEKVGKDNIVIIKCEGDRVTLTVPDTEKVTKLAWKKDDAILFEWAVSGLQLHANNITLMPGSAIVNNLEPGDSGSYNIEVHSTDSVTKSTLQLEVVKQVDKSKNHRMVKLKVVRKGDLPENGRPDSQPIRSITFHPIKMTGKTPITWTKDGQPVVPNGDRIKLDPNGDLTINNVTPEDLGKYSVHCEGQELEQEFILH